MTEKCNKLKIEALLDANRVISTLEDSLKIEFEDRLEFIYVGVLKNIESHTMNKITEKRKDEINEIFRETMP